MPTISLVTVDRLTPMSFAMVLADWLVARPNSMRQRFGVSSCFFHFVIVFSFFVPSELTETNRIRDFAVADSMRLAAPMGA